MGGCTNCKSKPGCDDRKTVMFRVMESTLAALYPSKTWGEINDAAIVPPVIDLDAFARDISQELAAPAFVMTGSEEDPCDRIDILCVGRHPCSRTLHPDNTAEVAAFPEGDEHFLRVLISQLAPVVAVQEVIVGARRVDQQLLLTETTRAGVFSPALLSRMQRLVALFPTYELEHLDFGDMSSPPSGFHPGQWPSRFGAPAPALSNYFFLSRPATLDVVSMYG